MHELQTIHAGHQQVDDDEIDTFRCRDLQSFGPILRLQYRVRRVLKHGGEQVTGGRIVVNDQNGCHDPSPAQRACSH